MRVLLPILFAIALLAGWRAGGGRAPEPAAVADMEPRPSGGTVTIDRGRQDHFFVGGDAGGTPLDFIVDTGASEVALSRADANRIGLAVAESGFTGEAETASGTVRVAPVTIPRLRVGDIQLDDVRGVVIDVPQGLALLGQSFLSRLDKVSIERDRMTLTKY